MRDPQTLDLVCAGVGQDGAPVYLYDPPQTAWGRSVALFLWNYPNETCRFAALVGVGALCLYFAQDATKSRKRRV